MELTDLPHNAPNPSLLYAVAVSSGGAHVGCDGQVVAVQDALHRLAIDLHLVLMRCRGNIAEICFGRKSNSYISTVFPMLI